eukprot:TRINITY_DN19347_c0_g1_i3.p1 TRINITY_DN19347_c0_g1~~TRINITY_DN19347_c0_g1_i3.p1  ORF type:complete len:1234 (-),score=409.87 TRINITY_DN19347_c0_g1_i3:112-3777(-)
MCIRDSINAEYGEHSPNTMDRETKRRQARLREAFRSFDLDMSGTIEKDELLTLARVKRSGSGGWDTEKNERLAQRISVDSEDRISQPDFIRYFSETWHGGMDAFSSRDFDNTTDTFLEVAARAQRADKKRRRQQLTQVFNAFDLDGNKAISSDEFYSLARAKRAGTTNPEWTSDKNEQLMKRVDLDRNGKVNLTEFIQYFGDVWHGGLSLFSVADFNATIKIFMALPAKSARIETRQESQQPASPRRDTGPRAGMLREVFKAFDIDSGGTIGSEELLALGKARRATGQASGDWTEQRNARLIARMTGDQGASGEVTENEFVTYFDDVLSSSPEEFDREIKNFMTVAEKVRGRGSRVSRPANVPKINLDAQISGEDKSRSRSPSNTAGNGQNGFQGNLRTPRERDAGLGGIFRMFDMERLGRIPKQAVADLATQAFERSNLAGSWSSRQNKAGLDALKTGRGNTVEQSDFIDFFKNTWYGGMANMSDAEYEQTIKLLRTLGRSSQTDRTDAYQPSWSNGPSSPRSEPSDNDKIVLRKRNIRLRDVFSLLDFSRLGDLHRADLRVLGTAAKDILDFMDTEGLETVQQSQFLDKFNQSLPQDEDEFETALTDMEATAKASRKVKEQERRERRCGKLERVFQAFDLDGSGSLEKDELYELGQARRSGNNRLSWTEEKNNRLVEKLVPNGDGTVSSAEFVEAFEKMLSYNTEEFDDTIQSFTAVAEQAHLNKSRKRQMALDKMNPIERAKHEAAAFTKDADIDIFKTKQEEGDKHDKRVEGEKLALQKAIKELLARQAREIAHAELKATEDVEGNVKREKVVAQEEHRVAEAEQEKSVQVEAQRAEEVETAITETQKAHKHHKIAATAHQEAVVVVEDKTEAKQLRAKEVADLEELLKLARIALGVADEELNEAQVVEDARAREEKEAKEELKQRKIEQADAEEEHRVAHADMVEKTKIEKEKHTKRKYEEHRHVLVDDMVEGQAEVERVAIKEMEDAIESALKQARIAVDRRDDHADAQAEAELAITEKKIRGIEEVAAKDWWNAEEAREINKKEQIIAAEKMENLKKAELRADWEDRRSAFARNRGRDESVIEQAQDEAATLNSVYQVARKRADETQKLYDNASLKARDSTDVAKLNRKAFDDEVLNKRAEYAIRRESAGHRGTVAYKEFLLQAAKEIAGAEIDPAALKAKVERALAMAMKGVDIYSSIPVSYTHLTLPTKRIV